MEKYRGSDGKETVQKHGNIKEASRLVNISSKYPQYPDPDHFHWPER